MSFLGAFLLLCRASADLGASEIEATAAQAFATDATPGMAVAVVRGDRTVFARGYGLADREAGRPVTADTAFYIASTTKSLTALTVALLHQRRVLDLDRTVDRYLPDLRLHAPLSPEQITLRDLLTHTHGISNAGPVLIRTAYSGEHTNALLISLLARHPPSPQGRAFVYGNIGYNVAGLVLDTQARDGWKAVIEREVLRPLRMTGTSALMSRVARARLAQPYEAASEVFTRLQFGKADANMHAAGGHVSTATDLGRYLRAHINLGRVEGRRIFPAEAIAETHRQQAQQDRRFGEIQRTGWGLGWDIGRYDGDLLLHRFGAFPGFRSHVSFMPEHGIGVVVLVNGGNLASPLADVTALSIYDRLRARQDAAARIARRLDEFRAALARGREAITLDRARRAGRQQPLPRPLAAYAGTYESSELGRMEWRVTGRHLEASMGVARSAAEVYDAASHKLRIELTGGGSLVEFLFPSADAPASGLKFEGIDFVRIGG